MNAETQLYYADRLVRAVVRGSLMTPGQRDDLAWAIRATPGCPKDLADAATALEAGALKEEAAMAVYRSKKKDVEDFNPDAIRESMGPAPDATREVDKRLASLLS